MELNINKAILLKAIKKWGNHSQMSMAIEECTELSLALQKHFRSPSPETIANVEDEIADVLIMMEQMLLIFNKAKVMDRVEFKMNRLESRINK